MATDLSPEERKAMEAAEAAMEDEIERLNLIRHDQAVRLDDRRERLEGHEQRIREDYDTIRALEAKLATAVEALRPFTRIATPAEAPGHSTCHVQAKIDPNDVRHARRVVSEIDRDVNA